MRVKHDIGFLDESSETNENVVSGEIRNVRFIDITARSEAGIVIYDLKEKPIKSLILSREFRLLS